MCCAFNRTSMELKHVFTGFDQLFRCPTFNRTSMELKHSRIAVKRSWVTLPFNRTSMELKLAIAVLIDGSPLKLLIEPVWN